MRIAYVCTDPGIPVFGTKGASIHVQEMLRAFLSLGAHVTLFSTRMGEQRSADLAGVQCRPLELAAPIDRLGADARADRLIALNDIVPTQLDESGPFDLVYERHALFSHAAMEWAQAREVASILEVNAPLIEEQATHRTLVRQDQAITLTRRAMRGAKHVIAVSSAVADYCADFGATARVVPNGVNPDRFPRTALHDGPFTVGFLGTLKPWHDLDTMIDAFALLRRKMPNSRLLMVGDGPERERVEAKLARLSLSGVSEFAGAVAASEVASHLARMSVGIVAYRRDQPFYFSPLKLYEYMAAGLPVVVSDIGGLDRMTAEGRFGLSVPPEDVAAMADALFRLASPDIRRQKGGAARAEVFRAHSWSGIARDLLRRSGIGVT